MPREACLRIVCVALLAAARVAVPALGLARVGTLQARLTGRCRGCLSGRDLESILGIVEQCARIVPGARCLARALTAQVLASAYGHDVTLRIGIREGERVEGHAWLERNGVPCLAADRLASYTPMEFSIQP